MGNYNVYNSAEQDDLDLEEGEILPSTRRSSKINIDYSEELDDIVPEESQRSGRSRPTRNKRRQNHHEYDEDIDDIDV